MTQIHIDTESTGATRPLPKTNVAFAPLPEGALLHDGQYLVVEVRAPREDEQLNVYLVEDTTPVRLCLDCQAQTTDPDEQSCLSCGADISSVEPLYFHYLMLESADEQIFAVEAQLLGMHLKHPGLLLPHDVFVEATCDSDRCYLVEPEFSPPLATTFSVPQEPNRVLEWGVSLAQALDYLHH